jgi:hypothetical protein
MLVHARPTTVVVNGVTLYGGKLLNEEEIKRITGPNISYFKFNARMTDSAAISDVRLFAKFESAINPLCGIATFVLTTMYEVIWRDASGGYWCFIGNTPKQKEEESKKVLEMIDQIERHLEKVKGTKKDS